jgi:hypothetical protein
MASRGSRTPVERAHDAAQSAATSFEDLPHSACKERWLAPMAVLLRFWFGSPSDRRREAAEAAYRGLVDELRRSWRESVNEKRLSNDELLAELKDTLSETRRRLASYAEAAQDSPAAVDDGLAFAVKVGRIISDQEHGGPELGSDLVGPSIWSSTKSLERASVSGV